MRKIAILVLSFVLTACTLTACRRNAAGETVHPTEPHTNTQATEHTTAPTYHETQPHTVEPTHNATEHATNPGSATDNDGILDDGTTENGRSRRVMPHY